MLKFFAEKMWVAFAVQKLLTFFQQKNIRILYIESAKTVNEMTLNELVKLTMLWTTGPWILSSVFLCHWWILNGLTHFWTRGPKGQTSLTWNNLSKCHLRFLISYFFIYKSSQYFLSSFESIYLWVQKKEVKIAFEDGGHLGFPIWTSSTIFDLQVTTILSIISIGLSFQKKKFKTDFQDGSHLYITASSVHS